MAVIINLKELFSSDAQDIYVDKVNFNFNKLLELGIGQPGPQGITGPLGSAGPQGIQGDDGQRGNKWFVGVGDPNTQIFPGLIIGDFYLETITSSVYQYQGSPVSWIMVTDFTSIVNNIITGSTTPFVRGFGLASPDDHRYITFTRHGNDLADITTDINLGNSANNDTLLLNNWNEKVTTIDNFPASTDDEFNSIQTLSVDHTATPLGRYHLELGSLYKDGPDTLLSDLNNNLKLRYTKEIAIPTYYPASNGTINKAKFSLTLPESETNLSLIDQQGFFEFETPLYNIETIANQSRFYTRIGTTEPLKETSGLDISSDGIEFKLNLHTMSLGMVRSIQDQINSGGSNRLPSYMDGDYGILNVSDSLNGTFIKENIYHTRGDVEKIHTHNEFESTEVENTPTVSGIGGVQGICSDGKYVMAVSQSTNETVNGAGNIIILDVSNPDEPITLLNSTTISIPPFEFAPPPNEYDVHGNPSGNGPFEGYFPSSFNIMQLTPLTNARDIAFNGNIGVIVRKRPLPPPGPFPGIAQVVDTFLVFEFGVNHPNNDRPADIKNISRLGGSSTFTNFMVGSSFEGDIDITELDDLKRVELVGNTAYCISGPDQITGLIAGIDSYFIAIDLTNPRRPFLSSQNIKTSADSAHIDFDISDEVAYVASLTQIAPNWELNLEKYSIADTRFLSNIAVTNTTPLASGPLALIPSNSRGCVKVKGQQVYVGFGDKVYIRNTELSIDETCSLISTIVLSDPSYAVYDLQIAGKYIYVNITDGTDSALVVYDITDLANPFEVDGINITDTDTIVSRSTLVGNKMFTVNEDSTNGTTLNKIDLGGIVSPLGRIGNLHSNDLRVSEDAFVGGDMYVGNSISVGDGGIQTGRSGLHSTGPIVVDTSEIGSLLTPYAGVASKIRGYVAQDNNFINVVTAMSASVSKMDMTPNTSGSGSIFQVSCLDVSANEIDFPLEADTGFGEFFGLRMVISDVTDNESAGVYNGGLKKYGLYISETGAPTNPMMNVIQGKTWIGNDIVNGFDYQKSENDYDLMLSTDNGNGGIRFKGHGAQRATGYDTSSTIENGQWGIQYTKTDNSDDTRNGLNFWKPSPSHNQANYKLFIADSGNVSIGFGNTIPDFDYGVSGNAFMGKAYAYNTPWSSGSATVKLAVDGPIGCAYVVTTSDSRLKDNVVDIDNSLERILKTRPVFYSWKDQEAKIPHGGFLAQELEEAIPEAIRINKSDELEGGKYSLHYDTLLAVSVGAIKELNKTIEEKEEKIKDLETRLTAIEEKIGL